MESASDGTPDGTYHTGSAGNGDVELRDPSNGNYNASLDFTSFSRNVDSAPEAINQAISTIFCLGCHDSNGSFVYVSGGSTTDPWNDTVTVMDVDAHFNTTNASWHPIKAVQDNTYCDTDTMSAPWSSSHYQMTCFDCHAADGASGAQTSTMVHGTNEGDTLRATYDATADTATALCVVCHLTAEYWTLSTHELAGNTGLTTTANDGNFGDGKYHDIAEGSYGGCTVCHGTTDFPTTLPSTAAERAENAHGFDTIADGSTTAFPSGDRPFMFLRYSNNMYDWNDASGGSAQCAGGTAPKMCGRGDTYSYGPSGSY
jgi:hypothetical protein